MQGYEIRFNVYAESQEEADAAAKAIKRLISGLAERGIAVTASKLEGAAARWKDSVIVSNYFK